MNIPLPDNGIPIRKGDTHYIYKNVYHPITWIGDEPYRPRVETLVVKDGKLIFLRTKDKDNSYELPGGSIDADSSPIEQAENETNEEALLSIKDIYDTGIQYYEQYPGGFILNGGDTPLEYTGHITNVFVANFAGLHDKRSIEKKDLDPKIADNGKFYKISDVATMLKEPHVNALLNSPYVSQTTKSVIRIYQRMNNPEAKKKNLKSLNKEDISEKLIFLSDIRGLTVSPKPELTNGGKFRKIEVYRTIKDALIGYQLNNKKEWTSRSNPMLFVYSIDCPNDMEIYTPSGTESESSKITSAVWIKTDKCLNVNYLGIIQAFTDGEVKRFYWGKHSTFKSEYVECTYKWISKNSMTQPVVESTIVPGNRLYHGSTYEITEFEPMSLNLGNAMERPGWCTFAFAEYNLALRFGLMRAIQKATGYWNKDVTCTWDIIESKPFISDKDFNDINDLIQGFRFFVYTIDASNLNVGIGNDDRLSEYTFDDRGIRPEKTDALRIDSTMLRDHLLVIPDKEMSAKIKQQETMAKYHHVRGWYSAVMTKDYNGGTASAALQSAVSKGYLKPGDDIEEYMNTHGLYFENDSVNYSTMQESVSSKLQNGFKSNGKKSLSSLKKVPLTDITVKTYKSKFKMLSHVRTGTNVEGYIYIDDDDCAMISVETKANGVKWIQALEITKGLQGYGLSKQLLDIATKDLGATFLSVNKKNEIAINLYKKNGWKVSDSTDSMFYMHKGPNNQQLVQESTKNVSDNSENQNMYFVSNSNMDGKTLMPRVPNNYLTKNGYEDATTKRVCFAPSIDKALMGLSQNLKGKKFFVHIPSKKVLDKNIIYPSKDKVPDVDITGEIWCTTPVPLKCIGEIVVTGDDESPGHKYNYGNNITAELYGWDWSWVRSSVQESVLGDTPMKSTVVEESTILPEENCVFEVAQYSSVNKYPIFITLMHTGTKMATLIKTVTGDEFSHATIAFNAKLHPTYSFGTKKLGGKERGLVVQNPQDEFFNSFKTTYATYVMYVSRNKRERMLDRLQYFIDNEPDLKYDAPALVACALHIPTEFRKKWFCSRFVAEILNQGDKLSKVPSLWKPQELTGLENISLVNAGDDFRRYDYKLTNRNLELIKKGKYDQIKAESPVYESKDIFESGDLSEYAQYADLDGARNDVQESTLFSKKDIYHKFDDFVDNLRKLTESSIYSDTTYRITYDGDGIYNALKNNVSPQTWGILLNSKSMSWLPKPPFYAKNNLSYFTRDGYDMFMKNVMPIVKQHLDPDKIKVETFGDLCSVCYSDKYQVVTESVISSKDDICHNIKLWESKKNNILLITGLSGSGKTTTAYDMSYRYKAEVFQLDWIEHYENMCTKQNGYDYGLRQYIYDKHMSQLLNGHNLTGDGWHMLVLDIFESILEFAQLNPTKLFIIEGAQIPGHLHDYHNIESFPIIIKGTSMIKSSYRRLIRDTPKKALKTGNTNILKYYLDAEKYMDMFRDQITQESLIPITEAPKAIDEDKKGDSPTDYTEDAGVDDVEPEEPNTGEDDDPEEATDYTEDTDAPENEEEQQEDTDENEDSTNDDPLEEEPTDYTDDANGGSGEEDDTGDSPEDDSTESSDTEENKENGNPYDNNVLKNYSLLKNFEKLYELTKEVSDSLDSRVEPTKLQNTVLAQVLKNMNSIKEFIISYVKFQFAEDNYPQNRYYYDIVLQSLKSNLKLLKLNKKLGEIKK